MVDPPRSGLGRKCGQESCGVASAAHGVCVLRSSDSRSRSGWPAQRRISSGAGASGRSVPSDLPFGKHSPSRSLIFREVLPSVKGISDSAIRRVFISAAANCWTPASALGCSGVCRRPFDRALCMAAAIVVAGRCDCLWSVGIVFLTPQSLGGLCARAWDSFRYWSTRDPGRQWRRS